MTIIIQLFEHYQTFRKTSGFANVQTVNMQTAKRKHKMLIGLKNTNRKISHFS